MGLPLCHAPPVGAPGVVAALMDPVLAGGFTLLGVFVAGAINYLVAWQNRATQVALAEQDRVTKLALAREEARRVRRERQVLGALDIIKTRVGTL